MNSCVTPSVCICIMLSHHCVVVYVSHSPPIAARRFTTATCTLWSPHTQRCWTSSSGTRHRCGGSPHHSNMHSMRSPFTYKYTHALFCVRHLHTFICGLWIDIITRTGQTYRVALCGGTTTRWLSDEAVVWPPCTNRI